MEKAILKSIAPQLVVSDVVATAEYFRKILGFAILGNWSEPLVYAMVARDGVEIHFRKGEANGVSNSVVRVGSYELYI